MANTSVGRSMQEHHHPREPVEDVPRAAEPDAHVEGAQWNEILARWERWDDEAGDWVEVPPASG